MLQRSLVWRRDGTYELSDCKTAHSRRRIPLSPEATRLLLIQRKCQAEERLAAGPAWQYLDLVFPTEVGTPHRRENVTRRHYKPLLKAADLPDVRLYDLRHSMATLLLMKGVNPKIVSERLGHSSVKQTLDTYSHLLPGIQEQATSALETALYTLP